ncbi:Lrp/AsnC family transcriptional regulator [Candidatus Pacearchaeota archaeon]|nr:Lrp/AsnC family transcriptional regulator [Candidatus Pacearchaeota archaeon]
MNKKDQKILIELIQNSRMPVNQLAKKIGLSREVATYRLNNLVKKKIITNFYANINEEKIDFSRSGCLFQLKNISKEKEKEFLDYLIKNKFVSYLGPIIGKWNLAFDILYKNHKDLTNIIEKIKSKFSKYIGNFVIVSNAIEQEVFQTKLLGINKQIKENISKKELKLDDYDRKILSLLSKNSRIEYKEISNKVKLNANAIKNRIKNLENSGIIQDYTISMDVKKLGYEWYNLQIKLSEINETSLKEFLRKNKKVIYFYKSLGNENWDLDIGLIIKNSDELREFILDFREIFGNFTRINDLYLIVEESKNNALPEGVFKSS